MYYSLIHERRCNKKPNTLKCLEYLDQSKSITGLALLAAALDAVAAADARALALALRGLRNCSTTTPAPFSVM